jgi:signal peptidase I
VILLDEKVLLAAISVQGSINVSICGDCMTPLIKSGDVVRVIKCEEYKVGDIILVSRQNKLYAHRVVEIGKEMVTKGDHSNLCDRRTNSRVLGKVYSNEKTGIIFHRAFIDVIKARISLAEAQLYRKMLKSNNKAKKYCFSKICYIMRSI